MDREAVKKQFAETNKKLSTDQLRTCRRDAYAMTLSPGNGLAEYREEIDAELARRA